MGKDLAQVVIWLFVPFTFYMFKRYPVKKAALYTFIVGLLSLPNWVKVKLPFCPPIGKDEVVGLSIVLVLAVNHYKGVRPRAETWWYLATAGVFISSLVTGLLNSDPVYFARASTFLPGHDFKDAAAIAIGGLVGGVPVSYFSQVVFRKAEDVKLIVRAFTAAGLIYSIFVLIEVRMSPQMHRWVYGYAGPHEWDQLIRYGGYRPLVMFPHGLVLSLFMFFPNITAMAMARFRTRIWKMSGPQAAWYLSFIILICKSTGVWFYAVIILPLVRFASSKAILRTAKVICLITVLYPWMRANEWIPTHDIIAYIEEKDVERAQSLEVRFTNEDKLLVRALERPWFGWGSYGRNRIYDEYGIDRCITDGAWVMVLGSLGIVGYGFTFMFTVGALLIASRRVAKVQDRELRTLMAVLILAASVLWFDNLPNAPDLLVVHFIAGAMCSISRTVLADQERDKLMKRHRSVHGGGGPSVAQAS